MSLLDILVSPAAAQAAGGAAGQPSMLSSILPLIIIFIVFWFLLLRPQMKRAKEHRELLAKLQKGDEVITGGGLAGRIEDLGESFVTVEIADKVSIKVQRGAITAVLPKGTLKSA
ncbi:MAG TPA: preprotein translocase subunit YajC [Arenimonas sp.]|uniref:preprotein translocase subunit YajC n=1 Tax=Arenimonas sp. TaxID=1872635 RepID=UPI002D7E69AF|nr:preprotein translocase subunit YajC [Arenimonas sp.]HEU0154088.1 preprotein translocase subunit YajC [Arenimonas sp.]